MLPHLSFNHAPAQANVAHQVLVKLGERAALPATLGKQDDGCGSVAEIRPYHSAR
jgi:hypothetical protein